MPVPISFRTATRTAALLIATLIGLLGASAGRASDAGDPVV